MIDGVSWDHGDGLAGLPLFLQSGFDRTWIERELGEELGVRTVDAIVGLPGRKFEELPNELQIKVEEEGAVK